MAFADLSFANRTKNIMANIDYAMQKKHVGMFFFQEIRKVNLESFTEQLKLRCLEVIPHGYNSSPSAFSFVTAYDPKRYEKIEKESKLLYLTRSENEGKVGVADKEENLGDDFTKSIQITTFLDKQTGMETIFVNTHLGLADEHKLLATKKITEYLKDYTKPVLVIGDFNLFVYGIKECVPFENEIKVMTSAGFIHASENLGFRNANKESTNVESAENPCGTFIFFPNDNPFLSESDRKELGELKKGKADDPKVQEAIRGFYMKKAEEILGVGIVAAAAFDAGFVIHLPNTFLQTKKTINVSHPQIKTKAWYVVNEKRIKSVPSREGIAQVALSEYKQNKFPFPSDHLPVYVRMNLVNSLDPRIGEDEKVLNM